MAKLHFVTHTPVLNILPFSKPYTPFYITTDDPNITNLMVSHYECVKQHNLRQFNLLNVKQRTEAPSDIKHASVKARAYVRAKATRIKVFKCVAYAKKKERFASRFRQTSSC